MKSAIGRKVFDSNVKQVQAFCLCFPAIVFFLLKKFLSYDDDLDVASSTDAANGI